MIPRTKIFTAFLLFALCVGISGCASLGTYNPATGKKEFIFIPTATEVEMGQELHPQITKEYPLSKDQGQVSRLVRIGRRLAQVSDRQDYEYQFFLSESKDVNAFTIPGGRIYVFSTLQEGLKTDDELAAVVAHEIGHCAARHTIKKFQAALGYDVVTRLIFSQVEMSQFVQEVVSLGSSSLMQLVFSAYSRQDEYEADRLGLKYMHLAGYDMEGMVKVLEFLEKESKDPKIPLILRTHPFVSDRINATRQEMARIKAEESPGAFSTVPEVF